MICHPLSQMVIREACVLAPEGRLHARSIELLSVGTSIGASSPPSTLALMRPLDGTASLNARSQRCGTQHTVDNCG